MAAGVKFSRKPKLTKKERELFEILDSVIISKEDLARLFNVSRATVYRLQQNSIKILKSKISRAERMGAAPIRLQPPFKSLIPRNRQCDDLLHFARICTKIICRR